MSNYFYFLRGFLLPADVPRLERIIEFLKPQLTANGTPVNLPKVAGLASLDNYSTLIPGTERWVEVDTIEETDPEEFLNALQRHAKAFNDRFRERAGFQIQTYVLFSNLADAAQYVTPSIRQQLPPLFIFSNIPGSEGQNAEEAAKLKTAMLAEQTLADEARNELELQTGRLRTQLEQRTAELEQCRNSLGQIQLSDSQVGQIRTLGAQVTASAAQITSLRAELESQAKRLKEECDLRVREANAAAARNLETALANSGEISSRQIEELGAELRALQLQAQTRTQQQTALETQLRAENDQQGRLEAELAAVRNAYEQQIAELTSELQRLRQNLESASGELQVLNSQKAAAIQDFAGLNAQLGSQDSELAALRQQLGSVVSANREETNILRQQLGDLSSCPGAYQLCEEQKTSLAEANEGLRNDNAELLRANRQLGANYQRLTQRITELEAQTGAQSSSLTEAAGDVQTLTLQISGLQSELAQQKSANQGLANLQSLSNKRTESLTQQLNVLLKEKQDLLSRNALLIERQDCTKAPEYLQLQDEVSTLQQRLAEKVEEYSTLETELQKAVADNTILNQSILPLQARIQELQLGEGDRQKVNQDIAELRKRIVAITDELNLEKENVRDYGAEIDRLSALLKEQPTGASSGPSDCADLQKTVDDCLIRGAKDKTTIEGLQKQIAGLQTRIQTIQLDSEHLVEQHKFNLEECARRANLSEEAKAKFRAEVLTECDRAWSTRLEDSNAEHESALQAFKDEATRVFQNLQKELATCVNK
jgi:chromosome segregation ATPase